MFLHRRKAGQSNGQGYTRKADSYGAGLEVANTSREIVERCLAITGRGSICRQEKARKQPLYRWNLRSNECREVIREIYPHLVGKQHQARLLLGCPSSGLKAEAAHAGLIALHNGQHCEIDFPAPESMFEPGWYLRQDIIWSKSNPMPESVRDRCTKAHEYIFMLTKSARYFYDADAIKNPPSPDLLKQVAEGYNGSSTKEFANGGAQDASETKARIIKNARKKIDKQRGHSRRHAGFNERWDAMTREEQQMLGSNKRSVWSVATRPYRGAHFATFPPELIRPCIKAGCPAGGVVLDPFGGSGTTGQVSMEEGRRSILIELNPAYGELISERLRKTAESMQPKPEKKRRAEYTEQKPKTRGDPNQIMFDGLDRTCDFPLTPSRDCAEVGA
jgi:DNA modification methylase